MPYNVPGACARVKPLHIRRAAKIKTTWAGSALVEQSRRKHLVLWWEPDLQKVSTPRVRTQVRLLVGRQFPKLLLEGTPPNTFTTKKRSLLWLDLLIGSPNLLKYGNGYFLSHQLGLAAVPQPQVAIDGHEAVARATKPKVLDLDYIARDRRVPTMISRHHGLGYCVRTVVGVEDGRV